ncbi:hypothetical protein TCON_0012 [Astathelohania contejeani]|uniref:Uncharacterized protein n=1 Tax=Astathelohania contejeani TaxID=164912 RepID=A0ABQ7I2U5_9MICR|nr:hypothetical protein TCON_0012 [Thelohania contejeani]
MDFNDVKDEELESTIEKYINEPFFQNHPGYITLWQRLFNKKRSPKILFLMVNRNICRYYHWLYIELSKYFYEQGLIEIAAYVLSKASERRVWDPLVIRSAIEQLPPFEKKIPEAEMYRILHPKKLVYWGKDWASRVEIMFCEMDGEEMSFEERRYKSQNMIRKNIKKNVNEDNSMEVIVKENIKNENNLKKEVVKEENIAKGNKVNEIKKDDIIKDNRITEYNNLKNNLVEKNYITTEYDNYIKKENILESKIAIKENEISQIKKLKLNKKEFYSKLENVKIIEETVYYIKSKIDDKRKFLIKLEGEKEKYCILHHITEKERNIITMISQYKYFPEMIYFHSFYICYKAFKFGSLNEAIEMVKYTNINEKMIVFWFKSILECVYSMYLKGWVFSKLKMNSIFVDTDGLKIADFSLERSDIKKNELYSKYKILSEVLSFAILNEFIFLTNYKSFEIDELIEKINLNNLEQEKIKFKILYYENIDEYQNVKKVQ